MCGPFEKRSRNSVSTHVVGVDAGVRLCHQIIYVSPSACDVTGGNGNSQPAPELAYHPDKKPP